MKRALVLAGGGVAGIAWELGVLRGIRDADPDLESSLAAADVIVGTSAGSAVHEPAVARDSRAVGARGPGARPGPGRRASAVLALAQVSPAAGAQDEPLRSQSAGAVEVAGRSEPWPA